MTSLVRREWYFCGSKGSFSPGTSIIAKKSSDDQNPPPCPEQDPAFRTGGVSSRSARLNLRLNPVVGTMETKTPPQEQAAFLSPVPGTGHTLD